MLISTLRNIDVVAAWTIALESLSVFVKDASECAIAPKTVKRNIGQNPIAMNASNCEAFLEVGLCLKAHRAFVTNRSLYSYRLLEHGIAHHR